MSGSGRLRGTHRYSGSAAHPPRPCFHPRQQGCYRSPVAAPPGPRYPTIKLVAGGAEPSDTAPALPAAQAGRCGRYRSTAPALPPERAFVMASAPGAPAGACHRGPALPAAQDGRCGPYQATKKSGTGPWRLAGTHRYWGSAAHPPPSVRGPARLLQGALNNRTGVPSATGASSAGDTLPTESQTTPAEHCTIAAPARAHGVCSRAPAGACYRGPALTAAQAGRGIRTLVATGPQVPPAPSTFFPTS
ncbi:g149 [Coccomyxa elongata]